MGYPLFIEPVVSDLPKKRKTVLSPAPANVQARRRPDTNSESSGRNRLTPAQWMQRYGPDHTTAARLRRTRHAPQPTNPDVTTDTVTGPNREIPTSTEMPLNTGIAVNPEITVLNALESYCRMHESLQPPFERRLRRVLVPRFDQLRSWTQDMIAELATTQRRLHGRGESHLWPAERERVRSRWLVCLGDVSFVTALTNVHLDSLRTIRQEMNAVASVNGPAALARVRLRAVRNRRWNASPTHNTAQLSTEDSRPSETESRYLARHLNNLRERWRVDDASTQRGTHNVDGLGDRERSPEDAWNTLRYTMTPDPELPSNSSSFTSIPNTTQRSFGQPEESRGLHWLGLTEMDTEQTDRLLPPTANGEPDCDVIDGVDDNPVRSRREQQALPGQTDRDVDAAFTTSLLVHSDGPLRQRRGMAQSSEASNRRRASRVVFGGFEDEARAIDAERQASSAANSEVEGRASPQGSMERFMSRIQERLGHTPTQGEWEGQLSVGADDDDDEEEEQPARALPETQRGNEEAATAQRAPMMHEISPFSPLNPLRISPEPANEDYEGSRSREMRVIERVLAMTDEEMDEVDRVQDQHSEMLRVGWQRHDADERRRVERERVEDEREEEEEDRRTWRREGEDEEAHRSRLLELMQSGGGNGGS